jgi:phosphatidylglycerol---prolipoprotein diacylglyceryl transferase
VPIALVVLDFDPFLRLGDRLLRLESVALAVAVFAAMLLAARLALVTPAGQAGGSGTDPNLRPDDLLLIVLSAVPGAIVAGRLGYVLLHADYYAAHPAAILDPGQGSLQLSLAVAGGALTGGLAARLIGEPVGRWLHVAALPLLVAIGLGKLAMALGGSGQGLPTGLPWATSYAGAGPWGSLAPELPSHPAQLYEAAAAALVLVALVVVLGRGGFRARDGRLFAAALGGWAAARFFVAATWRDSPVLGPLMADQLLSLAIAASCAAALLWDRRFAARRLPGDDSPQGSIVRRPGEASGPDELRGQG